MSVYVDSTRIPYSHGRRAMIMCHMLADSERELMAMADKIGLDRRWLQRDASTPHFDICLSKRELAVKAGALVVNRTVMAEVIKRVLAMGVLWFDLQMPGRIAFLARKGVGPDLRAAP